LHVAVAKHDEQVIDEVGGFEDEVLPAFFAGFTGRFDDFGGFFDDLLTDFGDAT
jgi:hypothetical protein